MIYFLKYFLKKKKNLYDLIFFHIFAYNLIFFYEQLTETLMKRILLLLVMMLSFAGANAQKQGFISTGQNVNVRTGPGKQYPLAKEDFSEEPCQLDKGMLVRYLGKKKNGFCYVEVSSMITEYYCKGWVSAKYLRPVKLCPRCNGEGYTDVEGFCEGKKCTRCGTKGYIR